MYYFYYYNQPALEKAITSPAGAPTPISDRDRVWLIPWLQEVVLSTERLQEHAAFVKNLIGEGDERPPIAADDYLGDEEIESILASGFESLDNERLAWLLRRLDVLWFLSDEILKELPDFWMAGIKAEARRVWLLNHPDEPEAESGTRAT